MSVISTTQKLTNDEFINELMTYSVHGPMMQVFVIEAVRSYSALVSSTPVPEADPASIINPKMWHAIACDVSKAFKENYETHQQH
jgi:hypothetical protein